MIIFPPIHTTTMPASKATTTNKGVVSASAATTKRQANLSDRRLKRDRRARRGSKHVIERRCGPERRRRSIDVSV
ncbi:MAG: hypothetical protein WCY88_03260 [Spongiibacteraceae bacterium]